MLIISISVRYEGFTDSESGAVLEQLLKAIDEQDGEQTSKILSLPLFKYLDNDVRFFSFLFDPSVVNLKAPYYTQKICCHKKRLPNCGIIRSWQLSSFHTFTFNSYLREIFYVYGKDLYV